MGNDNATSWDVESFSNGSKTTLVIALEIMKVKDNDDVYVLARQEPEFKCRYLLMVSF